MSHTIDPNRRLHVLRVQDALKYMTDPSPSNIPSPSLIHPDVFLKAMDSFFNPHEWAESGVLPQEYSLVLKKDGRFIEPAANLIRDLRLFFHITPASQVIRFYNWRNRRSGPYRLLEMMESQMKSYYIDGERTILKFWRKMFGLSKMSFYNYRYFSGEALVPRRFRGKPTKIILKE